MTCLHHYNTFNISSSADLQSLVSVHLWQRVSTTHSIKGRQSTGLSSSQFYLSQWTFLDTAHKVHLDDVH